MPSDPPPADYDPTPAEHVKDLRTHPPRTLNHAALAFWRVAYFVEEALSGGYHLHSRDTRRGPPLPLRVRALMRDVLPDLAAQCQLLSPDGKIRRILQEHQERIIEAGESLLVALGEAPKRTVFPQYYQASDTRPWAIALRRLSHQRDLYRAVVENLPPSQNTRTQANSGAMRPNKTEEHILQALRESNRRMTTEPLLRRALDVVNSHGKATLASMVKRQIIDNRSDTRPRGYGLPEWSHHGQDHGQD